MISDIELQLQKDSSIYSIQKADIERCARLMAKAFDHDPSMRYLLGGEHEGKNDWKYFRVVLRSMFGRCIMLSKDKEINELFVMCPPSCKGVPSLPFLLKGGLLLPFLFEKGLFKRSLNYESNCKKIKERFLTGDTWYMFCLVVEPAMQHQKRGSYLMRYALNLLDAKHAPSYLETHKAENVEIYKHYGFELKDVSEIPGTGRTQYAMLRAAGHVLP